VASLIGRPTAPSARKLGCVAFRGREVGIGVGIDYGIPNAEAARPASPWPAVNPAVWPL